MKIQDLTETDTEILYKLRSKKEKEEVEI